jgi:multidrug efflux pump subunit AcrB
MPGKSTLKKSPVSSSMEDILLGIVRRPFSVLMLGLGLVLAGFAGLTRIRVEYLPSIEIPIVDVITEFPELPPPQMEELVTIPIENALSSVAGVKGIRSLTRRGICAVSLTFGWEKTTGRDIEVRERIDSIFPSLPHGARKPIINSRRAMEDPFMILAVSPLPGTEERFAALVGSELKARLLGASSVASIRISGMEKREVVVEADSEALNAASLDIIDLAEAVRSGIVDTQTGAVLSQGKKHPVRISSEILTPHDIEELPVIRADGRVGPRISSMGRVRIESGRAHSFFHADGSAAVGIFLYPSAAYGELRASRHMRAFMKELEAVFAGELSIRIIEDGAERIRAEMRGLLLSILISVCGSLAVLRLLSGSLTLAWITAASIPASLSLVCLLMAGLSRSVNIISILGLALGTGMTVDNSIIVLAHIGETESEEETAAGLAKAFGPCAGSTLTSILVFFPIRFIPGMSGALFTDLALTIVILLAASFAAALTLTPALFRLKQAGARRIRKKPGFLARERPLGLALCAPLLSLALLPLLALGMPLRILPETRIRECGGFFIAEEGISAAEAGQLAAEIEKALLESGYARHTLFWGGFDEESPEDRVRERNGLEYLHFTLILSEGMGQDEARKGFERITASETGLPFTFDKLRDPFETLLGAGAVREVLVSGAERRGLGEERAETASLLDGLLNILPEPSPGSRGLSFAVDLEKAAKTGIDSERLIQTVKLETEGAVVTRMESSGGEWMDVRVRGRAVNSGKKLLERKVKNGLGGVSLK